MDFRSSPQSKRQASCLTNILWTGVCLLVVSAVSALLSFSAFAKSTTTIYFYSSETNINNFKSLKMEFDRYLAQFGPYEFQPFREKDTFEAQLKNNASCVILLSSWHYENIRELYDLYPVLVGARNGKTSQKRLLVTCGKAGDLDSIKAGHIASASSFDYTQTILLDMFQDSEFVEQLKILAVPKDIDALMSLGFGMAKSAIATDYSLEALHEMNPVLSQKISVVAESQESRLLILAAPKKGGESTETVISIFQNMAVDPEGKRKIRMLGLEGWKTVDLSVEADGED
ncbi:hypothetical protein CSA56_18380 [candidate division KSB3 bacterium]|uniref:Uncharacterized protein n=1 Tax=candidate division KSB3 bacterium TaxID=2044937 RepID=A0A2G6K701_9BACT|nr:MAG: hypothetical protein CSA56_18380 [candidate division KSB3 bacterium]